MGTEWGPGGELMGKGEPQLALNSRSSDASRSEGGSSAANASKPGAASGGAAPAPTDNGATQKKKRAGKFLSKQFEILTKASSGTSARGHRGVNLLGQDYIIAVPGSRPAATANATPSVDPDLKSEDQNTNDIVETPSTTSIPPPADHHRDAEKPPIEFVTAPVDYKAESQRREVVRGEPPLDFITERSPRMSPRVATLSTRVYASMSRSHSLGRSPSASERLSFSAGTPRSERSILSVPETVISSADHNYAGGSLKTESRLTSPSSLAEWSSHSLDRRGELSIAGLSLGEGRNISSISRRTDLSVGLSPARSDALDYRPGNPNSSSLHTLLISFSPLHNLIKPKYKSSADDTDSGVEMYHETTSASPGSYSSRRTSCSLSEGWMPEFEDSDGASHHYRRSKQRDHARVNLSRSPSLHSRSQSGSASSSTRNRAHLSPNTLRKLVSKELLASSRGRMRHHGDYYHRPVDSTIANSSNHSSRRHHGSQKHHESASNVMVLLGKYNRRKGAHGRVDDETPIALDSMTPEDAIAVFHDEVARMLLEEGQECGEAADVEEFLDGYMRLRSPFYVAMVDEFFRAVCVDCYKRPVELPVDGRSGSLSSKSLRSDSQLHHRLRHLHSFNTRL
jgi:hypothetical protein